MLLCAAGVLREPLLYSSLYLERNRARYDELLDLVRDWLFVYERYAAILGEGTGVANGP